MYDRHTLKMIMMIYIYIYIYIYIHHVKAHAIHCLHQPPTSVINTVSVAQGGTATPGATTGQRETERELIESVPSTHLENDYDDIYIYIYIYIYI